MTKRLIGSLASACAVAGCFSIEPAPPYDPGLFSRVSAGTTAPDVRNALGRPTTAMPAMAPENVSAVYPGCTSASEEWEYMYATCNVKLTFDDEGKLCHTKPVGLCGRRMQ